MKSLVLQCDCMVETMNISFVIENESEPFEGYITFSNWWDQNRTWRERFRVCWTILRGKSHYFDSIILDREDTEKIQNYLAWHLQQSVHVDFTTANTATYLPDVTRLP